MTEFQRTLYGPTLIPLKEMTVRERAEMAVKTLGCAVDPALRGMWAWMQDPHVEAFIHAIPNILTVDEARQEYLHHLEEKNGTFESEARSTRKAKEQEEKGQIIVDKKMERKLRESGQVPDWYKRYLKTRHWIEPGLGVRSCAITYYGTCVLCGHSKDLQIHHRHYRSLGAEDMHDVSVLCEDHHKRITPLVSIYVPRVIPFKVIELFEKEGIDITEFEKGDT